MEGEKEVALECEAVQPFSGMTPGEIVIGVVSGINPEGSPLVDYPGNPTSQTLVAISTLSITHQHVGRQIALLFAQGDPLQPVVMGLIHSPLNALIENFELSLKSPALVDEGVALTDSPMDVVNVDGKRIVIEGEEEVVLKCGEASITLTKAGKVLIRGKYLLSRSSGVNRIMGGAVQVN